MKNPKLTNALRRKLIARAKEMYEREGEIEVDIPPDDTLAKNVSAGEPMDGGAYVKAWVWVSLDDLERGDE